MPQKESSSSHSRQEHSETSQKVYNLTWECRVVIQTIVQSTGIRDDSRPPSRSTAAPNPGAIPSPLRSPHPRKQDLSAIRAEIKKAGVTCVIHEQDLNDKTDGNAWMVSLNDTINQSLPARQCAMNIKSPLFDICAIESLEEECEKIWSVLGRFGAAPNGSCGTHVQIWPAGSTGLSIKTLRKIAAAIVRYQIALEIIMPSERIMSAQCKPNVKLSTIQSGRINEIKEALDKINNAQDSRALASILCGGDHEDADYQWYFRPSPQSEEFRIESIEFRSPSASTSARITTCWAAFACCFVEQAYMGDEREDESDEDEYDESEYDDDEAPVTELSDLRIFIEEGASELSADGADGELLTDLAVTLILQERN